MLVVTGGGGFIGSVLAAELNAAGRADLVIVDRFGSGEKCATSPSAISTRSCRSTGSSPARRYGERVEAVFI